MRFLGLALTALVLAVAPAASAQDPTTTTPPATVPPVTTIPQTTTTPEPTLTEPSDELTVTVPDEGVEDDAGAAPEAGQAPPPAAPAPTAAAPQPADGLANTGGSPLLPLALGALLALAGVALLRRRAR